MFNGIYKNKKVLVTGHTGFKGSWLTHWLLKLEANVCGLSLSIPTVPSHFEVSNLDKKLKDHYLVDIRDYKKVKEVFDKFKPDIVFHLAAEPIVRTCYDDPQMAFETNVMGTVNVLEAIRRTESIKSAVIITSDKCYENVEWDWGYRETDRLGGKDPYSATKACAEIAFHAYFNSYLKSNLNLKIATTRAGNVIGGGDWARDRIVPDAVRATFKKESLVIRSPNATRPWQHVLEPLSGYLLIASEMFQGKENLNGEPFNFGPRVDTEATVEELLKELKRNWNELNWKVDQSSIQGKNEAGLLKLSCDKALRRLGWTAILSFNETMKFTADWYKGYSVNHDTENLTNQQIDLYSYLAKERGLSWAKK